MADKRLVVTAGAYEAVGNKIREWSENPDSAPRTVGQLKAQLGANITVEHFQDDEPLTLIFLPPTSTAHLVVPHFSDLGHELHDGYVPPDFYSTIAFGDRPADVAEADRERFRSCRIADYSMAKCV